MDGTPNYAAYGAAPPPQALPNPFAPRATPGAPPPTGWHMAPTGGEPYPKRQKVPQDQWKWKCCPQCGRVNRAFYNTRGTSSGMWKTACSVPYGGCGLTHWTHATVCNTKQEAAQERLAPLQVARPAVRPDRATTHAKALLPTPGSQEIAQLYATAALTNKRLLKLEEALRVLQEHYPIRAPPVSIDIPLPHEE